MSETVKNKRVARMDKRKGKILQIIFEDENSPYAGVLELLPPQNDEEYLQLWFKYLDARKGHYQLIEEFIESLSLEAGVFIYKQEFILEIENKLKQVLEQNTKDAGFVPVLEQYLDQFDDDREQLRTFLLVYLHTIYKDQPFQDLISIQNEYNIKSNFIYSLSPEHKLVKDRVLVLDPKLYNEKLFHTRPLERNIALYKIFAGHELNEGDKSSLLGCKLLTYFGNEEDKELYELNIQKEESINNEKEPDDLDIEDLFVVEDINENMDNSNALIDITDEAYKNDLEYLYNESLWLNVLIDLQEKKTDSIRSMSDQEFLQEEQKLIQQKNLCFIKLEKSKKVGLLPKLEGLAIKLRLTDFEKNVLKMLTVTKIFINSKNLDRFSRHTDLGSIIYALIDDPLEQVKAKKYFFKNSKLIKYNLINLNNINYWEDDFYSAEVTIDNRLVEFFQGENYNFTNYIDGGYLSKSKISIDNVIIDEQTRNKLLETVDNFPSFLKAKKRLEFFEVVEYGNALVMLFVGPSGTGKTLLANAIANYLDKKIITFNFNTIKQFDDSNQGFSRLLSMIFRESRINDAVLFFDESEVLLNQRINDVLLEIEKHEGLVIFASNATFTIDEAMRRRINYICNFNDPTPSLRKKIWEIHLPQNIEIAKDVDLNTLAKKYEINGGLIKNAVFGALAKAVNQNGSESPKIEMKHFDEAAKEQLSNKLFMSKTSNQMVPRKGVEDIILADVVKKSIVDIINFEKSQKILRDEWGFDEIFTNKTGTTVLFHGASGTGKTLAAEVIARETGKNLKVINYSQLVSKYVGETAKNLEAILKETTEENTILLFDEAEGVFAKRMEIDSSNDKHENTNTNALLGLIEAHNLFVILTTNKLESIDEAFYRRMRFIVEFEEPDEKLRLELWKKLLPPKLPISDNIDLNLLAEKYELNGGDIKNVLIRTASRKAVLNGERTPITTDDFAEICSVIEKNKVKNKTLKFGF